MARFMYTDAVQKVACPQCNQPEGQSCRLPSGRKCSMPHGRRVWALQHMPGFNVNDYKVVDADVSPFVFVSNTRPQEGIDL